MSNNNNSPTPPLTPRTNNNNKTPPLTPRTNNNFKNNKPSRPAHISTRNRNERIRPVHIDKIEEEKRIIINSGGKVLRTVPLSDETILIY
jgi:hypothetical protein